MTLKQWIKKERVTLKRAAELVGVARVTVWRITNGKRSLSLNTMNMIVRKTKGEVTHMDLIKESRS